MTDFDWPPETRAAMTAEARHVALRDALWGYDPRAFTWPGVVPVDALIQAHAEGYADGQMQRPGLRDDIAQAMFDEEQRRHGLPPYPLGLTLLHRDAYRARADVVMRVFEPKKERRV